MKQKLIPIFLSSILLLGCTPAGNESVSCKIITAVPDHSKKTLEQMSTMLDKILSKTAVSGWTMYPVYGAWRPGLTKPFINESSIAIEILGKPDLIHTSQDLAHTLETALKQEEVLVFCVQNVK
ncbi:MAG: hypothetical protein ACHQAX_00310 [Gammaproteobacteria bacterium]